MRLTLSVLNVASTTGVNDALTVTSPTPDEPVRLWDLALSDDTDGAVSISFDGVNEHVRLTPSKHPTAEVRFNSVKLWAWKVTGGATYKLIVGGATSVEW